MITSELTACLDVLCHAESIVLFLRNGLEESRANERAMRKFQKEERRARRKMRAAGEEQDAVMGVDLA